MNKRTKTTTPKQNRMYMVRTTLVLVFVALFFAVGGGILYVKNQTTTQIYTSNFMKLQFDYPTRYSVREKYTSGTINEIGATDRNVKYGTYGTNFSSAIDHIQNLLRLNKTQAKTLREIQGPYSTAILENNSNGTLERSYFFVKDYAVYYFSTDDPALFSDLDSIAKSFRILE